jgi:hypothetical protein
MFRSRHLTAAIAATLLCFAAQVARADAASDKRLADMEQRITSLEDKLSKSQETIDAQAELLKSQATPAVSQGSALDAFLSTVQFNGFVAASYEYNFNNPSNPIFASATNQFNVDHNTFNFDAVKIELTRPATNPGDAGFAVDLTYGDNANILAGTRFTLGVPADFGVYVQDAYVSYNLAGTTFKFGKWETLLGYEVIDSVSNRNVTHGLLFTYAIPLVHTGIQASGKFGESPVGWAAAYVNGWNNVTDTNDNKGVLAQLNFSSGPLTTALTGYWGADGNTGFTGQNVQHQGTDAAVVLDWTATLTASDALTFWANADWGIQKNVIFQNGPNLGTNRDPVWYGLALGSQFAFTDKTSFALRGEWLRDGDGYRIAVGDNTDAYSLTGTLAYKLTTNLLTRAELRYDGLTTRGNGDRFFPQGGAFGHKAVQGLVNVAYIFD